MAKVTSITCPYCGAAIVLKDMSGKAVCEYCRSEVPIINENETIIRHVDEAGLRKIEMERELQTKHLEQAESVRSSIRRAIKIWAVACAAFFGLGILLLIINDFSYPGIMCIFIGLFGCILGSDWIKKIEARETGKIKAPSVGEYEKTDVGTVSMAFTAAGFTNVKTVPMRDLRIGVLKRAGSIGSIQIGDKDYSSNDYYDPNALVVISYHSYS